MASLSQTIKAKSDQLNADDIVGAEPILIIEKAVLTNDAQQPVSIYYQGCNNRPYKPSLGMRRAIAFAWGADTDFDLFVGRALQVYREGTVKWAGKEAGGIRIKAMSHIDKKITMTIPVARNKREPIVIDVLNIEKPAYPEEKFNRGFPAIERSLKERKMTAPQVIAQCQKTGLLTQEQVERIYSVIPPEESDK